MNVNGELWYPRNSADKEISVTFVDVRAANDLYISYDYDRDGWVISSDCHQPGNEFTDKIMARRVEVSFITAWPKSSPFEVVRLWQKCADDLVKIMSQPDRAFYAGYAQACEDIIELMMGKTENENTTVGV